MMNHPALLAAHTEQFAEIELQAKELDELRRRIIELAHDEEPLDSAGLRARLEEGFAELVRRVDEVLARTPACWQAGPEAADRDAEQGWMQALTLHRKCRTLHRELKAAEAALAADWCERNLNWLRQIKAELARVDGEEAQLEGFGEESGRPARSL
jgi:DNA primase